MSSFCKGCGNSLSEADIFCPICGRNISVTSATPPPDPAIVFGLAPETSGKAIFSLVCGVLCLVPPAAIVAVIFGHLSLSEIRRSAGKLAGRGLAVTGLVLGYAGVALTIVWLVLIGIAIPRVMRAQREAIAETPETSAVSVMRALNTAEIAYAQAHREAGYTCSMFDLSQTWALSTDLARGQKNGYVFELQGCAAKQTGGPIVRYQVVAYTPQVAKSTGKPAFCSNESDVIKVARNGSPQDCLRSGVDLSTSEINHPQVWTQPR